MSSHEPALRVIRMQTQFEVAELAAQVAQATAVAAEAQFRVGMLSRACESTVRKLREAMLDEQINPALIDAMRRMYHVERGRLLEAEVRLVAAQEDERRIRAGFADVRNKERTLECALKAERHKQRLERQAREIIQADDMWLQHLRGALS